MIAKSLILQVFLDTLQKRRTPLMRVLVTFRSLRSRDHLGSLRHGDLQGSVELGCGLGLQ